MEKRFLTEGQNRKNTITYLKIQSAQQTQRLQNGQNSLVIQKYANPLGSATRTYLGIKSLFAYKDLSSRSDYRFDIKI